MASWKSPVDAMAVASVDIEADRKAAPEDLVRVADATVVTIHETPYLRINVAAGMQAVIAIVAAVLFISLVVLRLVMSKG